MSVKMRLWRIEDGELKPVRSEPLEDWLVGDISMVADDLLVIGRQLQSELGGILDVLAMDRNGDLAVLELKRDKTPRDVVAQALEYAAWVRTLSWEDIAEIARAFHGDTPLEEKVQEQFGEPLPETVNTAHRMYIVAAEIVLPPEKPVRVLC